MQDGTRRRTVLSGAALAAALVVTLVAFAAQDAPPPAPPPAAASPQAPQPPAGQPAPPAAELPRIIRVVCTDHICGHCDGKCHKDSGHGAVDKKGHSACTPNEGSPLDSATKLAYEKSQPK